jgi:hypothetical protein
MEAYRHLGPLGAVRALSEVSGPAATAAAYRQALRDAYWNDGGNGLADQVTTVQRVFEG